MKDSTIEAMLRFGAVVRRYREALFGKITATHGLTERDISLLEFLAEADATFAAAVKRIELRSGRGTSRSAVSQALAALERKHGFVKRSPNQDDFRQPIFALTAAGKKVVKQVQDARKKLYHEVARAMSASAEEEAVFKKLCEQGRLEIEKLLAA